MYVLWVQGGIKGSSMYLLTLHMQGIYLRDEGLVRGLKVLGKYNEFSRLWLLIFLIKMNGFDFRFNTYYGLLIETEIAEYSI